MACVHGIVGACTRCQEKQQLASIAKQRDALLARVAELERGLARVDKDAERLKALLLALEVAHPDELALSDPEVLAGVGRAITLSAKRGAHLVSQQELTAAIKG